VWGRRTAVASLEHGILYPERAKPSYATIVALHGRGADARDLLPIVRFLGLDDVLVIAPRAPLSLNLGMVQGYAWYEMNQVGEPHTETFHRSLEHFENS